MSIKHWTTNIVGHEGEWIWSHSGQPLTESSWAPNFPNTTSGNTDDCGVMVVDPMQLWWEDCSCATTTFEQKKVAPICQHNGLCPAGGWKLFEGHCYQVVESSVTWAAAEKDCNNKGGHLASIHSADENSFIHSLYSSNWLWIGGTDAAVEVGFTIYINIYELKSPSA